MCPLITDRMELVMGRQDQAAAVDLLEPMAQLQLVLGMGLLVLAGLMVAVVEVAHIANVVVVFIILVPQANPAQSA